MKINGFGQAEILKPAEISLLLAEGFVKERDRALFGICLYTGARIYEACTLLKGDVASPRGVRPKLIIRRHNTKGSRDTREIQIHPVLKGYLEAYISTIAARGRNPYLFPGPSKIRQPVREIQKNTKPPCVGGLRLRREI